MHDKRTGTGKSVIRGTETYSGGWKDGEFHGRGVHCDARGNVYDGEVRGELHTRRKERKKNESRCFSSSPCLQL